MHDFQIEKPRHGKFKMLKLFLALIFVGVIIGFIYFQTKINSSATTDSHEVNFVVEKGMGAKQIAEDLSEKKLITSPTIFVVYVYLNNAKAKMQAGDYVLNSNMSITEIVDVLTHGKVTENGRRVTIIEGLSNKQIANLLLQRNIISSTQEFDSMLTTNDFGFEYKDLAIKFKYQGFLFPDTYILTNDGDATELVSKMLNNFETKLTNKMLADMEANGRTLSDVLILASIIEKEVGRNKEVLTTADIETMQRERELVASVFYNRLDINMALESDATVNYVTGKSDRSATIEDTKIQSPYNTYQTRGLPPTPISNPGIGSIMAAINPADSDYLYFLNSPEGVAYFARTLAEHGENRQKYLR